MLLPTIGWIEEQPNTGFFKIENIQFTPENNTKMVDIWLLAGDLKADEI